MGTIGQLFIQQGTSKTIETIDIHVECYLIERIH